MRCTHFAPLVDAGDFVFRSLVLLSVAVALQSTYVFGQANLSGSAEQGALSDGDVFWSNNGFNRADIDGSDRQKVVWAIPEPEALGFDETEGKLYWSENGTIYRGTPGVEGFEMVLRTGAAGWIRDIAIDDLNRKLYWAEATGGWDWSGAIWRANLDGSNVEVVADTGLFDPAALEVDPAGGWIYWSDLQTEEIRRLRLDRSEVETVLTSPKLLDIAFDHVNSKLYWTTNDPGLGGGAGAILRSEPDGSLVDTLIVGPIEGLPPGPIDAEGTNGCSGGVARISVAPQRNEIIWTSGWYSSPGGGGSASATCRATMDGDQVEWVRADPGRIVDSNYSDLRLHSDLLVVPSMDIWFGSSERIDRHNDGTGWFYLNSCRLTSSFGTEDGWPTGCESIDLSHWETGTRGTSAIVVDPRSDWLYWSESYSPFLGGSYSPGSYLRRVHLDGSDIQGNLLSWNYWANDLAFDRGDGRFHIASAPVVDVYDLNPDDGLDGIGFDAYSVAIDTLARKRYVLRQGPGDGTSLAVGDIDATGHDFLVAVSEEPWYLVRTTDLGVDVPEQRLYWFQDTRIRSARTDGTDLGDVLVEPSTIDAFYYEGLTQTLYWVRDGQLYRRAADGGPIENLWTIGRAGGLSVIPSQGAILKTRTPHPTWPQDRLTGLPTSLNLRWEAVAEASRYNVRVALDPNFNEVIFRENVPAPNAVFVAPRTNSTFFWRVQGVHEGFATVWSDTWQFTVGDSGPLVVRLLSPSENAGNQTKVLDFRWTKASAAAEYHFELSESEDFASLAVDETAIEDTTFRVAGLKGGTRYFWRVGGVDERGRETISAPGSFTTVVDRPLAVTLEAPPNDARGVSIEPVFRWLAADEALMYQIQVGADSLLTSTVVNDSALTVLSDSLTAPLASNQTHFWRVRARNAGGDGPWSDVWTFRTAVAQPDVVALGLPEDGATGVSPIASVTWQALDEVAGYHAQLATDAAFEDIIVDDSMLTTTVLTVETPIPYSTVCYWHVRGVRDDGLGKTTGLLYGPWSETRSFTVAVGTAAESEADIPTVFALHPAYPNPFNPSTTIRYDLPKAVYVRLIVYDALGRQVRALRTAHSAPGTYSVAWDASTHPSGMYFVRMEAGGFTETRRMILTK